MPKGNCFRTSFASKRVHGSQTLYKSPWEHFHPNFSLLIQDKLSWQKGPESDWKSEDCFSTPWWSITCILVIIKRNSRNKFTRNSQKNEKSFLQFLLHFWNLDEIFIYLENKDQLDSVNISEVMDSAKCSYLNAKKELFQNTFRDWTCSRFPNTAKISMAELLS